MTACAPALLDGRTHELRVGYTLPALVAALYRGDGTVVDLSDAVSVKFVMRRRPGDTPKIDRAVTILTPRDAGRVRVDFTLPDVDTAATYKAFFVVTYTDGSTLPVPTDRGNEVTVVVAP